MAQGEVVLLTGATGAVGSATAKLLYQAGFTVALTGRRAPELQKAAASLGERAHAVTGDIETEAGAEKLVGDVFQIAGRLDALVSTVGGIDPHWPALSVSGDEALLKLLALNLFGPLRIARASARVMQSGGRMAFVSSRGGVSPQRGPYDLSKAALQGMISILASELKDKGIRVNAVAPSIILTPANVQAMPDADTSRWITPEEVGEALVYLASTSSSGITGTTLHS